MTKKIVSTICCVLFCVLASFGQAGPTGTPSFAPTYKVNKFLTVNLQNLTLLVEAPVRKKEGPIPLNYRSVVNIQEYATPGQYATTASSGWILASGYWGGQLANLTTTTGSCPGGGTTNVYNFQGFVDGNGTAHFFTSGTQLWDSKGCLYTANIDAFVNDSTGYEFVLPHGTPTGAPGPNPTLYDKRGMAVTFTSIGTSQLASYTDLHGNAVNINTVGKITDALTSTAVLDPSSGNYVYTDGSGTSQTITVNSTAGTLKPAFLCSGIANNSQTIGLPLSLVYPDGSTLSMTWEKTVAGNFTGRLATMVIPTGATYTFGYSGGTNGDGLWCHSSPNRINNATMTISNGTGTWTFASNSTGTSTTVTKPDGSLIVYAFTSGIVTSKTVYDTNGTTVLDTWTFCYNSTFSNCNPSAPVPNPSILRVYHTVPGVSTNAETDTSYDSNGNVTEVDSYDFGPTLVRKAITTYGSWNGSSCVSLSSIHVVAFPCDSQIQDGSSNVAFHSKFKYSTSLGDLLNKYSYTSASAFLTSSYVYNTNGTLQSVTTPDNVQTSFTYTQCNGYLPDSITTPATTSSMTWNCNLALPATATNPNGLVTTFTRNDSLNRVTDISDNSGQPDIVYSYPSTTQSIRTITDSTYTSKRVLNLDTLGNLKNRKIWNGSNYDTITLNYDSTNHMTSVTRPCTATITGNCSLTAHIFTYDGADRRLTDTLHSLVGTNGVNTYTYSNGDVLLTLSPHPTGENNKIIQREVDGLGRTASVCYGTSSLSGSGSCGQRTTMTGYKRSQTLNALGLVTQLVINSQSATTTQTKSQTFDLLGRVTQTSSPERGTINYTYDSTGADCSSFAAGNSGGHITEVSDAVGNHSCFVYEGSGRISNIYYLGTDAANSPAKAYKYDSANTIGTGSNLHGHLSAALVCASNSSCTGTPTIQDGFGYDSFGNLTDQWHFDSHFNSAGTSHITVARFANGALSSISGVPSTSGTTSITYGVDSAGRPNTATLGGTSIVSSTTYDAGENATSISFANGDSDTNTFDPLFGLTSWSVSLNGSTAASESITFNANGSRGSTSMTGPLAKSCSFTHDDLFNPLTDNCGSTFNFTYTYDPFSNPTRSGTFNWMPGYDQTNNRLQDGSTYDSNGRTLKDGGVNPVFGWSATNTVYSKGSIFYYHDALNRPANDSNPFSMIYSPIGNIGRIQSNGNAATILLPLPGGDLVAIGATNLHIVHRDGFGTSRTVSDFTTRSIVANTNYGPYGEPNESGSQLNESENVRDNEQNHIVGTSYWGDDGTYIGNHTRDLKPPYAGNPDF